MCIFQQPAMAKLLYRSGGKVGSSKWGESESEKCSILSCVVSVTATITECTRRSGVACSVCVCVERAARSFGCSACLWCELGQPVYAASPLVEGSSQVTQSKALLFATSRLLLPTAFIAQHARCLSGRQAGRRQAAGGGWLLSALPSSNCASEQSWYARNFHLASLRARQAAVIAAVETFRQPCRVADSQAQTEGESESEGEKTQNSTFRARSSLRSFFSQ